MQVRGIHHLGMAVTDLDEAIDLANDQPFGLTSGLQSLDDREVVRWMEGIEAGNLYVNRSTTGAIVGRQPFGGWKGSSVGPGAKAGGQCIHVHSARHARVLQRRSTYRSDGEQTDWA